MLPLSGWCPRCRGALRPDDATAVPAVPAHLRALVVILLLAGTVFLLARKPLCEHAMAPLDFQRRVWLWLVGTLALFLAHDFWLFATIWLSVLLVFGRRDPNPIALYAFLLLSLPGLGQEIPGFGVVNYLFDLTTARMLVLAILLPAALRIAASPRSQSSGWKTPDILLLAYLAYNVLVQAANLSATMVMRGVFGLFLDVWLPYFVASRSLRDTRSMLDVAAAMVLALAAMSLIAMFESVRHWLLYSSVYDALGLPERERSTYLLRGETGMLRARATAEHSIIFGYAMMVGVALLVAVLPKVRSRAMAALCALTILGGLLAALSRGPWVGAVVAVLVGLGIGRGAGKRWPWMLGIGLVAAIGVMFSPAGDTVLQLIPFVGEVDSFNVSYRQRLFEISLAVLWQNPWFGSFSYIQNPLMEQLRQGQGIIDMVNVYLAIALSFGVVGLVLFLSPFVWACWKGAAAFRQLDRLDPDGSPLGRALLAAMAGVAVTIATNSNMGLVPRLYWLVLGLVVAYAYLPRTIRSVSATQANAGAAQHRPAARF
jgi:O-Antigen ligase